VIVSAATGLVFGIVPALQTARLDVSAAINEGGRGGASGTGHHRLRALLVVSEMALATMLLVGAGLLTKSLLRLQDVSPGFDPRYLLVAEAPLSPTTYATPAARNAFVDRVLADLGGRPGVQAAEVATAPPFTGAGSAFHFNIAGRPPRGPEEYVITNYRAVSSGFFTALGVPLLGGRAFDERDRDRSQPVAIVNETFVRRFFNASRADALRAHIQIGGTPNDEAPLMDVVGVVGDTKQAFEADVQPTTYVPYAQFPIEVIAGMYRNVSIVAKASGDAAPLAGAVRAAVAKVDANQPLVRVRTMEAAMADSVAQPRLRTTLLTLFTLVALALSIVGVYGVMAYAVSERMHEIGVRIALGATPGDIRSLIVGQGVRLAAAGIAFGIAGAAAASRALGSLLFDVSPLDPATFGVAAVGLAAAALAAVYGPARRASRVDPVNLLR
jgi:putative ABC transport system permease protein